MSKKHYSKKQKKKKQEKIKKKNDGEMKPMSIQSAMKYNMEFDKKGNFKCQYNLDVKSQLAAFIVVKESMLGALEILKKRGIEEKQFKEQEKAVKDFVEYIDSNIPEMAAVAYQKAIVDQNKKRQARKEKGIHDIPIINPNK